jgi:hypothetical protein
MRAGWWRPPPSTSTRDQSRVAAPFSRSEPHFIAENVQRESSSEWLGAGPERTTLGTPRLARLLGGCADDSELIAALLAELGAFTGVGWEQGRRHHCC